MVSSLLPPMFFSCNPYSILCPLTYFHYLFMSANYAVLMYSRVTQMVQCSKKYDVIAIYSYAGRQITVKEAIHCDMCYAFTDPAIVIESKNVF